MDINGHLWIANDLHDADTYPGPSHGPKNGVYKPYYKPKKEICGNIQQRFTFLLDLFGIVYNIFGGFMVYHWLKMAS